MYSNFFPFLLKWFQSKKIALLLLLIINKYWIIGYFIPSEFWIRTNFWFQFMSQWFVQLNEIIQKVWSTQCGIITHFQIVYIIFYYINSFSNKCRVSTFFHCQKTDLMQIFCWQAKVGISHFQYLCGRRVNPIANN